MKLHAPLALILLLGAGWTTVGAESAQESTDHAVRSRTSEAAGEVTGVVKSVDPATGRMWLALRDEEVAVDLPRSMVEDFAPGDNVSISLDQDPPAARDATGAPQAHAPD